jgi:hypothetical protein
MRAHEAAQAPVGTGKAAPNCALPLPQAKHRVIHLVSFNAFNAIHSMQFNQFIQAKYRVIHLANATKLVGRGFKVRGCD